MTWSPYYRAFAFDFDDTLMATRVRRWQCLSLAGEHFGVAVPADRIAQHWGKPFRELIRMLVPTVPYRDFVEHYSGIMRNYPPEALPGTEDVLRALSTAQIPIFVLSSGIARLVRQDLEAGGLWQYIDRLWGSDDTAFHKPDGRALAPLLLELQRRRISIADAVFVGDGITDYCAARANAMPFVGVLTGSTSRSAFEMEGLDPLRIVSSLRELGSIQ